MKLVFAGTPAFAANILEGLLARGWRFDAVYTQADRPRGRGKKLSPSEVKSVALNHQIPVYQPDSFKPQSEIDVFAALEPTLMLVVAYGMLLPKTILSIPTAGCLNVHTSLLPRWRGAAPIQYALLSGDKATGVSLMKMDEGLDTGPVYKTLAVEIADDDTFTSLSKKLEQMAIEGLDQWLKPIISGDVIAEPQTHSDSSYAPKIEKQLGKIDWSEPAELGCRKVRALNPNPGAFSSYKGERFKILRAELTHCDASCSPGEILAFDAQGLIVAASDGTAMRITELQLPGKRAVSARDLYNGKPQAFNIGERCS